MIDAKGELTSRLLASLKVIRSVRKEVEAYSPDAESGQVLTHLAMADRCVADAALTLGEAFARTMPKPATNVFPGGAS